MLKANSIYADLHAHSNASDGELSPDDLVGEASEKGLRVIALTDHDTIAGLPEAITACIRKNVKVICGAEVSIRFVRPFFTGSLHYLLYFPERMLANPYFLKDFEEVFSEGRGRSLIERRIKKINTLFGPQGSVEHLLSRHLSFEEIAASSQNVTRRHFAQVLCEKHGLSVDAVNRLLSNQSPAYIPSGIEMQDLGMFLKKYQCIKILAHPAAGSFPAPSVYKEALPPFETVERLLPEFLSLGLDGLEIYYPGHLPEYISRLEELAESYKLLSTGGSDSHDRIQRPLGVAGLSEKQLEPILDRIESIEN